MGATKELSQTYRQMGEDYLTDIDMSGGLYLEHQKLNKQKLEVEVTNFGFFRKAQLNGLEISKEKLYEIIGIEDTAGMTLEFHLFEFEKRDSKHKLIFTEKNVE